MDIELIEVLKGASVGAMAALAYAMGMLGRYLLRKTKNELWRTVIARVQHAASSAVIYVGQTYTDELKDENGDGKIGKAEARHAFDRAFARAKDALGPALWGQFVGVSGGEAMAEKVMEAEIEASVDARNDTKKALRSPDPLP